MRSLVGVILLAANLSVAEASTTYEFSYSDSQDVFDSLAFSDTEIIENGDLVIHKRKFHSSFSIFKLDCKRTFRVNVGPIGTDCKVELADDYGRDHIVEIDQGMRCCMSIAYFYKESDINQLNHFLSPASVWSSREIRLFTIDGVTRQYPRFHLECGENHCRFLLIE